MGRFINLTGQKFAKLTVIGIDHRSESKRDENGKIKKGGLIYWKCRCDCGNETIVEGYHLRSGHTKSCGCGEKANREYLMQNFTDKYKKHGMRRTRIYRTYCHMKGRCLNPTDPKYKDYGGRGIKICEEWLGENGFINFYNWAMANGYNDSLTIDRIEVDGNYEPSNCRWADLAIQANNKRRNLMYDLGGGMKSLAELCREYNKNYATVNARLKRGLTIEEALGIEKE